MNKLPSPSLCSRLRECLAELFTFGAVKDRWKYILIHVGAWAVFLCIPHFFFDYVMSVARNGQHLSLPPLPPTEQQSKWFDLVFVIFNASYIVFYYLNTLVLIPRLLSRRHRMWYILSILLAMVIIVSVPSIVIRVHYMGHPHHESEYRTFLTLIRILFTTLLFAIIFIVSTGMRLVKEWYHAEQQAVDVRHEQTATELSLLKAQVNPHFLFNTLNNIYSLSVKKSDHAPEAIMMLADMMRYVLSDAQNEHVTLDKDLEYLSEFIRLQKLRLTDKVTIEYEVTGHTDRHEVAPLMLLPFVENAFKYGISTHDASTISIRIKIAGDVLYATVINKVLPQSHQMQPATGTGLANVRRRLHMLYPGKHTLDIRPDDNGLYIVILHLNMT